MRVVSVLCVIVLMAGSLVFAPNASAQCENSDHVASFTVGPSTIVGDGYQAASGEYTTAGGTPGVQLQNTFGPKCIAPSYWAGDTGGCAAIGGTAKMTFSGTISQTQTFNMKAYAVPPYISAYCPDPGIFQSLTVLAPPTGTPPADRNTPNPVCPDGSCTPGGSAQAGSPINLLNGNTWIEQQDFALPGLGGGLELTRTWNSAWPNMITWPGGPTMDLSGMFGHSWRSTYEERLQTLTDGITKYWHDDGNSWFFTYDGINQIYVLTDPVTARGTLAYDSGTTQYTLTFKDGSKRFFNSAGRLIAFKDSNGNQTSITLDGSNRITQVTDAAGRIIYFDYLNGTFPNLATALRDSVGTLATYLYDASGRLIKVTYADNAAINYVYDASNLIASVTDTNNVVLESHTYDAQRRGTMSARANNVEKVTVYYLSGPPRVLACNAFDRCQTYSSTKIGRQTYFGEATNTAECATCGAPKAVVNMYDPVTGNLMVSTPADRPPTFYSYDSQANLTRTVQQSTTTLQTIRREWNYTYNGFGQVLTAVDPLGKTTTNTYDVKGNLLTTTTPSPDGVAAGSTTTFAYNTLGLLSSITDPRSNATAITYTAAGLIETITDAQSKVTKYEYDARGNRTAVTEDFGGLAIRTTFEYDLRNRLKKINHPTNPATATEFAYDTRGRRTSVTDANGKITTYAYDTADRLTSVTDAQTPSAGVTTYAYDNESNLTSIADALGRVTTFTYMTPTHNNLQKITFPPATPGGATLNEQYAYNNQGQVTWMQDRKAQVTTFGYDGFGNMFLKQRPEGAYNYFYDAAGRLIKVEDLNATNGTGKYEFSYDFMGRMTQAKTTYKFMNNQVFTVDYGYDAASNRTGMTDPQSSSTTYVYDTLNRLQTLQSPQGNFGFVYDALSRRTQLTRPNGVNTNYSYDSLSRLLTILHQVGANTIDGATYTYDNAGNRLTKLNHLNAVTDTYGYDNIYQLLSVLQGANTTESYSYDKVGNRLSSLGGITSTVNNRNQLTTLSGSPNTTFTYDNNGNTATKVDGTGTTTYTWNSQNELKQVTLPGGATVTFKYDPFGRRVQKVSASSTINYLYDAANMIEELDSSGNVIANYAQGGSIDQPLAMLRGNTSYYQADGLGSVTSLSDSASAIANSYTYDAFGKISTSISTLVNPMRYTARDFDSETGLHYFRARYYDTGTGRFLSEDPSRFVATINFYSYVGNSPTGWVDPTGLQKRTPGKGCPNTKCYFPDGRGGGTDREFGPDGRALKDIDHGHDHGQGDPNVHDWDWKKNPPRQPGRAPRSDEWPPSPPAPSPDPNPPTPEPPPALPKIPIVPRIPGGFPIMINPCLFDPTGIYLPQCRCGGA